MKIHIALEGFSLSPVSLARFAAKTVWNPSDFSASPNERRTSTHLKPLTGREGEGGKAYSVANRARWYRGPGKIPVWLQLLSSASSSITYVRPRDGLAGEIYCGAQRLHERSLSSPPRLHQRIMEYGLFIHPAIRIINSANKSQRLSVVAPTLPASAIKCPFHSFRVPRVVTLLSTSRPSISDLQCVIRLSR